MISANGPTDTIDTIIIDEFGDNVLTGIGTPATGTFASMAGFVTVTETTGGPIAPVIIPFVGTFTPSSTFSLPGDFGTSLWNGSVTIDVVSQVPNATKATLSLDNDLFSNCGAGNTSGKIQKKVVSGPAIIITVPEASTLALLGSGLLLGLAVRARSHGPRRRA